MAARTCLDGAGYQRASNSFTNPRRRHPMNTREVPFAAWKLGYNHMPPQALVLHPHTTILRRCAYVFWDLARIQRYQLLPIFDKLSESPMQLEWVWDRAEQEAMSHSWEERSKIYQKGGRGYWNGDDSNRSE
ncbi:hypothetical protein F5B22DRAFT_571704 [Xylaria bambusicola]|uniref:uncharacterized protein n=1 Tax=Xylaria bambusicola TaxID=326684 RepID=UPI002007BB4A|nr:uncharacterized protein F5B22DRAFT_571704 [Xylaria bambusicola]KAI0521392.1 hypothetical protein F5B22DRAFT_571704 [Xylaria bambusicola]